MKEPLLLTYIRNHPDSWREDLAARDINIRESGDLACFKYGQFPDFADPLVCESRGIILDIRALTVVCRPFDKFFNVQESFAADIDWSGARVQEKIDGSIIKLYFRDGKWVFATNSTITAEGVEVKGYPGVTYADLVRRADNYGDIPFERLDPAATYIFELVSPMTQVVISYPFTRLFHLGTRDNVTGQEREEDIGIVKPGSYPLRSLDDCLKAAEGLNTGDDVMHEGFVVVDRDWKRVKIKSPQYLMVHRMSNNHVFTPRRMAELYLSGADLADMAEKLPLYDRRILHWYLWQFTELEYRTECYMAYVRALFEEYGRERGPVARKIGKDPLAFAGFKGIGNELGAAQVLKGATAARLSDLIRPYESLLPEGNKTEET